MNIENFKSIVLINLIVISLFLTFNLWTYVPETSSSSDAKYVQDNEEIPTTKLSDVIYPSHVILQKDNKNNVHYVTTDEEDIDTLYEVLKEGEFHDFREIPKEKHDFFPFVHDEDKLEIVFPTDIPLNAMRSTFIINEKKLGEYYSFNRILIDLSESMDDDIKTYFVSYGEEPKVYEMTLKGARLTKIKGRKQAILQKAEKYSSYDIDGRRILFPARETEKKEYLYFVREGIDESTFKNVLFTDPRYVKAIKGETENTYTDGIRLMKVLKDNKMLQYTNSSVEDDKHMFGNTLVQRSFDFINSHNGFSNTYRLDYMNNKEGKTIFRSYKYNLPVFNEDGMSKLEQVWGEAELISYKRPLLDSWQQMKELTVTLPTGSDVIQSLVNNQKISMKKVKDIGIGYKLMPEGEANGGDSTATVRLKPIWYVVYGDDYQVFEWSEEEGGELIGLE